MEDSPQIQRAMLLAEQGRHQMAEKELRQHLAQNPQDGFGQALLSLSLLEQERRDEAEQAAREAADAVDGAEKAELEEAEAAARDGDSD